MLITNYASNLRKIVLCSDYTGLNPDCKIESRPNWINYDQTGQAARGHSSVKDPTVKFYWNEFPVTEDDVFPDSCLLHLLLVARKVANWIGETYRLQGGSRDTGELIWRGYGLSFGWMKGWRGSNEPCRVGQRLEGRLSWLAPERESYERLMEF